MPKFVYVFHNNTTKSTMNDDDGHTFSARIVETRGKYLRYEECGALSRFSRGAIRNPIGLCLPRIFGISFVRIPVIQFSSDWTWR